MSAEPVKREPPTIDCRCWACGDPQPMGCGALCADCSWDDHCGGMARNGDTAANWEPKPGTPACCLAAAVASGVPTENPKEKTP